MVEVKQNGGDAAIVECVPNFSEGRDAGKVRAIVSAMRVEGVSLLDWSLDADHNRSVVTVAGAPAAVVESAVRGAGKAAELIDLTRQEGVHPRMGAADVIPFVPVKNCSLAQCAMLARQAGSEIWKRYEVPVYFYEAAAARPDRVLLEDVRKGQFEGLRDAVRKESAARPDVGGPYLHPTAGASAVGARKFLVAYNIYLKTNNVAIARAIAREIRAANGGIRGVKALGVLVHGQAQLTMNLTDVESVPVSHIYQVVTGLARQHKTEPEWGELIGLIPEGIFERESDWVRQLHGFDPANKILERRLESPLPWPEPGIR